MFSRSLSKALLLSIFALVYLTAANPAFMMHRRDRPEISSPQNPTKVDDAHSTQDTRPLKHFDFRKRAKSTNRRRNPLPSYTPLSVADAATTPLPTVPVAVPSEYPLDLSVHLPILTDTPLLRPPTFSDLQDSINGAILLESHQIDTSNSTPLKEPYSEPLTGEIIDVDDSRR